LQGTTDDGKQEKVTTGIMSLPMTVGAENVPGGNSSNSHEGLGNPATTDRTQGTPAALAEKEVQAPIYQQLFQSMSKSSRRIGHLDRINPIIVLLNTALTELHCDPQTNPDHVAVEAVKTYIQLYVRCMEKIELKQDVQSDITRLQETGAACINIIKTETIGQQYPKHPTIKTVTNILSTLLFTVVGAVVGAAIGFSIGLMFAGVGSIPGAVLGAAVGAGFCAALEIGNSVQPIVSKGPAAKRGFSIGYKSSLGNWFFERIVQSHTKKGQETKAPLQNVQKQINAISQEAVKAAPTKPVFSFFPSCG
jgi:hypothetical protein